MCSTFSAYDGIATINEFGIADLQGFIAGEKALAIAIIANPKFRDDFMKEIVNYPYFTLPKGYQIGKLHRNVTY